MFARDNTAEALEGLANASFGLLPAGRKPGDSISLEQEAALRAAGYRVKRPRFTKQDVRKMAGIVFPGKTVSYEETGVLEITGIVSGPELRRMVCTCKRGDENRMRTGMIKSLMDGPTREQMIR